MGFEALIGSLAIVTLVAAIGFALWSKRRTQKMMEKGKPEQSSPLARETQDPNFKPDTDVTNPQHVKV